MTAPETPTASKLRPIVQLLLVLVVIGAGVAAAAYFKKTAPKTKRRPPMPMAPLVETLTLKSGAHQVHVSAMGVVVPADEMTLKARVGGQVVNLHPEFTVGGLLEKGQELLRVDDSDYRLAVARAESAVVDSEYALSLERGRQAVARKEWSLLNGKAKGVDADLALRKPHLAKAEADVAAARAALEAATLDLSRTRLTAPFNAMVRTRQVAMGSQIGTQEALAELVGTDRFWVEVSLPVDRLTWIRIPRRSQEGGAPAMVHYGAGHRLKGKVVRLRGDLTTEGRMARVLVAVDDPLGLKTAKRERAADPPRGRLLMGEYVRVEIEGRRLENVIALPRVALHDGDTVWLATPEGTLAIREVTPIWRDAATVVVKAGTKSGNLATGGLAAGDTLIVSALSAPVDGMPLRTETDRPTGKGPGKTAAKKRDGEAS